MAGCAIVEEAIASKERAESASQAEAAASEAEDPRIAEIRRDRAEARRRSQEALQAYAQAASAARPAPALPDEQSEERPLSPREEAAMNLSLSRSCIRSAEAQLAYVRDVERTTNRVAPSVVNYEIGQRLVLCRAWLAETLRQCKKAKTC